jgi:ribonuclease HI
MAAEIIIERTFHLFTDGSCINNGQEGAIAGIGVFIDFHDARNVSKLVQHHKHTNNTAELLAIIEALSIVIGEGQRLLDLAQSERRQPGAFSACIFTDSLYSINALAPGKTFGPDAANVDLISRALEQIKQIEQRAIKISLNKVQGHTGLCDGNFFADLLATAAANGFPGLPASNQPFQNRAQEVLAKFEADRPVKPQSSSRKSNDNGSSTRSKKRKAEVRSVSEQRPRLYFSSADKNASFALSSSSGSCWVMDWTLTDGCSGSFKDLSVGKIEELSLGGGYFCIKYMKPAGPMENEGEAMIRFETLAGPDSKKVLSYFDLSLAACVLAFEDADKSVSAI